MYIYVCIYGSFYLAFSLGPFLASWPRLTAGTGEACWQGPPAGASWAGRPRQAAKLARLAGLDGEDGKQN